MKSGCSYFVGAVLFLGLYTGYPSAGASARQLPESHKRTFTGAVTRNPDNRDLQDMYILYDQTQKTNYFLDDARKAEQFDGTEVEVVGTPEKGNTTIHVDSITPKS
jgi:3-mercaptopyruvate sulfurtransferase SseA